MDESLLILTNPEKFLIQETTYLTLRQKEGRIYNDEELMLLPVISEKHPSKQEWKLRERSSRKLVKYLAAKQTPLKILEIGCGNGWLSHNLSKIKDSQVTGEDINRLELEQGVRVFGTIQNLKFIYADIFEPSLLPEKFDAIIVASAIQYFPDPEKLVNKLLELLQNNGEIHILDSPLYKSQKEANDAKERSAAYFQKQGSLEMGQFYFHHSTEFLNKYSHTFNESLLDRIRHRSSFPWVVITKK